MEFENYKNLLKHVYKTAPFGLCLFDKDLRFQHINEWLALIHGHSVDAHLGRIGKAEHLIFMLFINFGVDEEKTHGGLLVLDFKNGFNRRRPRRDQ